MVDTQIVSRGVRNAELLKALYSVPREAFIPAELHGSAYHDTALHLDEDLTLPQPYVTAFMLEALDLDRTERVLQIGVGSGYATALLAELAQDVYAIERAGRVWNIVHIMSLNPRVMKNSIEFYSAVMFGRSPLTRVQRETLAIVVAKELGCHY